MMENELRQRRPELCRRYDGRKGPGMGRLEFPKGETKSKVSEDLRNGCRIAVE